MKKALLLSGLIALGMASAQAAITEPEVLTDFSVNVMSPNGRYMVSSIYGTIKILDRQTNQMYVYGPASEDEEYTGEFDMGLGNAASSNGVVLGNTNNFQDAVYWQNGVWTKLSGGTTKGSVNSPNGITPDGSRICGSIGRDAISLDSDNLMCSPCIWERQADGTYSHHIALPHPEKDLFGTIPQYVTAISISDDGKTIVGQIVDNSGMLIQPIVYTEDSEGKWSYSLPAADKFNPDNLVVPPVSAQPAQVNAKDFMTEDEIAAYDQAYDDYRQSNYSLPYPEETDYMSAEKAEEYNKAQADYRAAMEVWNEEWMASAEVRFEIIDNSPQLVFNNVLITPNGSKYYTTDVTYLEGPDPMWPEEQSKVACFDLKENALIHFEAEESMGVTSVANNDVVFASNGLGMIPAIGYMIADGKCTEIATYLKSLSPELSTWIDDNMVNEIEDWVYNEETESYDVVYKDLLNTGLVCATPDLNTVAVWNDAAWDYSVDALSYIFDLSQFQAGVADAVKGDSKVAFDAEGNLALSDDIAAVEVYDLTGRRVLTGRNTRSLQNGVYVVRATTVAGDSFSTKIAK